LRSKRGGAVCGFPGETVLAFISSIPWETHHDASRARNM
jgi:hypothetical protein